MIRRILSSTAAAAAILAAAPTFAEEAAPKEQPCSCCSDGSIHQVDHPLREAPRPNAAERKAPPRLDEDPAIRAVFGG
jgi:hypothetical protein